MKAELPHQHGTARVGPLIRADSVSTAGGDLAAALGAALDSPRFIAEVLAEAPFADTATLLAVAARVGATLSAEELSAALAAHPRIGDRPVGTGTSARLSRSEQAASDADPDPELAAALAAGNAEYERRFGRVFLIRAAGRSRTEILAELHRRLDNPVDAELAETGAQLLEIALLRLTALYPAASNIPEESK